VGGGGGFVTNKPENMFQGSLARDSNIQAQSKKKKIRKRGEVGFIFQKISHQLATDSGTISGTVPYFTNQRRSNAPKEEKRQ